MTLARSVAQVLRLNALRLEQRPDVPLFVFGVNGRVIHQFASVQPAERSADGVLEGYQRAKVQRHIAEILSYLSREDAILPNAIVIALGEAVAFTPLPGALKNEWGTPGCLRIPLPVGGWAKPAFIVDGQQRVAALAQLDPRRSFPVVVIGFHSESAELQREQFVVVNRTKPLPRDLLNELLPHIDTFISRAWTLRRVAARVMEILRFDKQSPFYGRIRGLGASGVGCNMSQAAILEVIETSIRRGGVLTAYGSGGDDSDIAGMAGIISLFFSAVARTWRFAWNESPRTSRLVHGVGIAAMGRLMDVLMAEVDASRPRAVVSVMRRVSRLEEACAWTGGRWPAPLDCPWDALQNTPQDRRRLAEFLVEAYVKGT
jgi:DGQHR domain-containing protein